MKEARVITKARSNTKARPQKALLAWTLRALASALALFAVTQGCNCNSKLKNPMPGVCSKGFVCEKGEEYRKGVCETARCDTKATGASDCCPGQFCRFDGKCVDDEM